MDQESSRPLKGTVRARASGPRGDRQDWAVSALGRRLEDFGGIHKYSVPSPDTAGQECALLPLTLGGGAMCLGPLQKDVTTSRKTLSGEL